MSIGKVKKVYKITPVSKPRMTQRDKWAKRPCVVKYFAFKDEVRKQGAAIPTHGAHITFYIAMPKSWTKKRKEVFNLQPHQSRPDVDNYLKGIFDAVFDEDCRIWDIRATKLWAYESSIEISSA